MRMVLLNSGGIDSRVAAAVLRAEGHELLSFHVNWGRPARWDRSAEITAEAYCVDHYVFTFPRDWTIWKADKWSPPHTGSTLAALAAGYALLMGTTHVASGTKADAAKHPDSRLRHLVDGINSDRRSDPIRYHAPLFDMTLGEEIDLALRLGVDLATTWSCPEPEACGRCSGCQRRAELGRRGVI